MNDLGAPYKKPLTVTESDSAVTIVHIAPGWLYCVSNLLPCCKVAWEICDCRRLACYTAVHRDISSKLFKGDSARDDCIATAHILSQGIEQLFEAKFSGSAR